MVNFFPNDWQKWFKLFTLESCDQWHSVFQLLFGKSSRNILDPAAKIWMLLDLDAFEGQNQNLKRTPSWMDI